MCALSIEELTKIAPEDAIALFKRMLEKTKEHVAKFPSEHHWLNSVEEVLPLLAAQPDELVAVVSTLKALHDEMKAAHPPLVDVDWSG